MKRTVTSSTTVTSSAAPTSCIDCKSSRCSTAFLPCGHQVLCLKCADSYLSSMTPCCPTCQLRFVDFIAVPFHEEPSKLAQSIMKGHNDLASGSDEKISTRPRRKSNDFNPDAPSSDLPVYVQLRQSPNFAQARDLYARAMGLLGDGASACTTPVIERPAASGPFAIPPKSAEAFKLFVQSAGLGFPFSQFMVAIMLQGGIGCEANEELSLKWLKKAATGDLALAQIQLAQMYNCGRAVYKDLSKMSRLYRKAATTERSFALVAYGYCLLFGHGVDQDFELAREVLLAANNAGDKAKSLFYLGLIFFNGLGVPVSPKNAFEYFLLAATAGEPSAQHWVSRCFAHGLGTKESQTDAAKWAQKAATAGIAAAQHDIGCRLMTGNGIKTDLKAGVSWTEKAVEQNHVGAIVSMAFYFSNGQGVEQSDENAEACRALARDLLEDAPHRLEMGECLEFGEGSDRNVDSAKVWYREAGPSSVHAEFALFRHGEITKRVKKNKKSAENDDTAKVGSSSQTIRPRSKSAFSRADLAKAAEEYAAETAATTASSSSSSSSSSSTKEKSKTMGRPRSRSGAAKDAKDGNAALTQITEDAEGEAAAAKKAAKRPKSMSIQFKRSASNEALKNADTKRTRFVPLEINTALAQVAIN